MTKAGEWADAKHRLSKTEIDPISISVLPALGSNTAQAMTAAVGHANYLPTLCLNGLAWGNVVLAEDDARRLARWILDTFGETA